MTEHTPQTPIPDTIPANLADLLARKSGELGNLPDIHFSDDNSAELAVLISMLVTRSSSKPDHRQFMVAGHMLICAVTDTFRRMVDTSVEERSLHGAVALIAQAAAGLGIAQFVTENLMVLHKRMFGMDASHNVSDRFLASIGMDREGYKTWLTSKSTNP